MPAPRHVRLIHFNPWAEACEPAAAFLARLPGLDLRPRVSDPADAGLLRKARLDCDWHGECARCFASLEHPEIEFLPALVFGQPGVLAVLQAQRRAAPEEEWWLAFMGQHPQNLGAALPRFLTLFRQAGGRILYYAFDEASRTMPCFDTLAPHLEVLIHDESPLATAGRARLRAGCRTWHRSWVANVRPFAAPFHEAPEEKILFLGSGLGLTPHRRRQLDFLREKYSDRLVVPPDYSVDVPGREVLNRYKVGFCPEGRKFDTPGMAQTHTDRPFWCGCYGLVPVSEDSRPGGRLEELHRAGLIRRYAHADLRALAAACEAALALPNAERRRIYEHFNRQETVGAVVAAALAAAPAPGIRIAARIAV